MLRTYALYREEDLRPLARMFPEGITLCSSELMAGKEHVREVLSQASEYWKRGQFLARNRSIDLLMRITCQSQISQATAASHLEKTNSVVFMGLVGERSEALDILSKIDTAMEGRGSRDDSLLEMNQKKAAYLRKLHRLPSSYPLTKLLVFLQEKSVLLSFER
jgi:tRNA threonylcarbamoyladenosine modification (KEOPS) complex Cgi121 subunit